MAKTIKLKNGRLNSKTTVKKEKLPSKHFDKDKWKEFNEFVRIELEDMKLTLQNVGF